VELDLLPLLYRVLLYFLLLYRVLLKVLLLPLLLQVEQVEQVEFLLPLLCRVEGEFLLLH
jgi:hypothetical protein